MKARHEHDYYFAFNCKLKWFYKCTRICSPDLRIMNLQKYMLNYNYNLGFEIDRLGLAKLFEEHETIFVTYDNGIDHAVKLEIPYDSDPSEFSGKRKKVPKITFIIHRSGAVTQSGPNEERIADSYYYVIDIIGKNKKTLKI